MSGLNLDSRVSLRKILGAVLILGLFALAWRSNYLARIQMDPTVSLRYLGIGIFCLWTASRLQMGLCLVGGVALRLLIPVPLYYYASDMTAALGMAGFCGFVLLLYWVVSGEKEALIRPVLVPAFVFTAAGDLLATMLRLATTWATRRYDLQIYAIDNAILPSVVPFVGKLLATRPSAFFFEGHVYYALPGVLVLVFAFYTYRQHNLGIDLLMLYLTIGIVGFLLYLVAPACGPVYAFGSEFPFSLPSVHKAALSASVFQNTPNAMPSLHFANALMLYWNSKPWRGLRIFTLIFLVLTCIATLGTGEHYVTDLIVAVPFTLALQSVFSSAPGRIIVAVLSTGLVFIWLVVILAVPVDAAPHWLLWVLAVCSVACPALPLVMGTSPCPHPVPHHSTGRCPF